MRLLVLSAASIAAVAAACHAANAAYCRSLGDDSQMPWGEAPENIQASVLAGVEFHLANPDAGDAASHENWLAFKEADGWVFGEVKDLEKKTHPCMVPFDELPKEQQFKDALFRTIVHATAPHYADLEGAAAKAAKAKPSAKEVRAPKARKIRPIDPEKEGEPLSAEHLQQLIADAETVEVAFSDGKQEIAGIPALRISGPAWSMGVGGLSLNLDEVIVHGPDRDKPAHEVAGYGLLIDGDFVAYANRGDVLKIPAGATMNLARDVIFRG